MKPIRKLLYAAALIAVVIPLAFMVSNTAAMYLTDGSKEVSPGVYSNPQDGVCVVGVAANGTMVVDKTITNARDCAAYTTGLSSMTGTEITSSSVCGTTTAGPFNLACNTSANCKFTSNGAPAGWDSATSKCYDTSKCTVADATANDGYKHAWSASICMNGSNGVSRVDLDNTAPMCTSKGGTIVTSGVCVAYGWQYMNAKTGEMIPYRSTITPAGYKGRTSADNLGFCYMAARMTSVTGYNTNVNGGCPSYHNDNTLAPASEWPVGTDGVKYQTQASYDAGLGWSFASSQCIYAYGVKGYNNAIITKANGTTIAANTYLDGTNTTPNGPGAYTTMGDCLANGFSWDNWLPAPPATLITGIATTLPSNIMKLDATTPVLSGGGKFYSGTGSVCLKCHSDQSRSYMERNKTGFVETGHKLAGNTAPWSSIFGSSTPANKWKLKGVQCEVCHATGKPTAQDVGIVVYSNETGTNAGLPRAASGHNQTEYGSHVNGVCFYCHGTMPSSGNPASVIPVSGGDFAKTTYLLAPIGNQFLNSPHAMYTGANSTVSINTKTNYDSTFIGYICRSSNSIAGGSILTTVFRNGAAGTIPNLDSLTNPACTNTGNGSATSGAGGFVVREGEAAGTANSVAYVSSDQGDCMTCHDIHWSLDSTDPEAEPIRRECATCHVNPGVGNSASGAPPISSIRHPQVSGAPNENGLDDSCETCHMPKTASGSPMHLWRINTDASYTTMGATRVNIDGSGEAWVDLDLSCGQCHGPSGSAHLFSKAILSQRFASGMHGSGAAFPTVCLACHSVAIGDVAAISSQNHHLGDCLSCHARGGVIPVPSNTFCLGCHSSAIGDVPAITLALISHPNYPLLGTPGCAGCHGAGGFIPTVAAACNPCHGGSNGPTKINQLPGVKAPYLTASTLITFAAQIHKNVAPKASMNLIAIDRSSSSGIQVKINEYNAQVKDTSTDANKNLASIKVTWGDGTSTAINPGGTTSKHSYTTTGSKTITLTATDSKGLKSSVSKTITVIR